MINVLWLLMTIIGIVYATITSNLQVINDIILNVPLKSFDIMLNLFLNLVFWNGILTVAKDGGFLTVVSKGIKRMIRPLFKNIPKDHVALEYISGNIAANMMGLGSAATPLGLKAMEELSNLNGGKKEASKEMITLLVLNTSGLTIIPTSILALRQSFGADVTVELIPKVIIASIVTTTIALMIDYIFRKVSK